MQFLCFAIWQVLGQLGGTMPPKQPFSAQRAQEFGDLAVANVTDSFRHDGLESALALTCAYRGIATPDGGVNLAGLITAKTTLVYDWRVVGEGFEETHEKRVNCNNASIQGVPFPVTWTTALKCLHMSPLVASALESARSESGIAEVDCKFLGAARMAALAEPGDVKPGATLMLETSGTRMAHILCAWVRDSVWLCHRGTFDDRGNMDKSSPFDERSLVTS